MHSKASYLAKKIRVVALGTMAALAAAACGSTPGPSATPTGSTSGTAPSPALSPSPSMTSSAISGQVGAECGLIPPHGIGSFTSMSTQDAVAAAASNPQLSVFIAAVRTAGLDKTLNAKHAYTLIVPVNSAFASLSKTQIIHLKNSGYLRKVVRYHAVSTRITPRQFATGAAVATMEGRSLKFARVGTTDKIGGATVLCGNIVTKNATVYIVSKVLEPPK